MANLEKEKSTKTLFINFEEIDTKAKAFYSFALVLGISISFALVGYYIYPLYVSGQIALHMYLLANAGVSVVWVALINIINKFVLQDKLITRGTTHVNS